MKSSLLIFLSLVLFIQCAQSTPSIKTPPGLQDKKTVSVIKSTQAELTIDGMMCAIGCAASIEKRLNSREGILTAKVDFETKKGKLTYDGSLLTKTEIIDLITAVGLAYSVTDFKMITSE